jgi:hypothetical protein
MGTICVNGVKFTMPWDAMLVALLDNQNDLVAIYRAERAELEAAMDLGKARKEERDKHALSVNKFRRTGAVVWSRKPRLAS